MITREADYAIRAILYLSKQDSKNVVSTSTLSQELDIPYRFLRKIVKTLSDSGLVTSRKGKNGGLRLKKSPSEISVLEVIETVDKRSIYLNTCLENEANCKNSSICVVHKKFAGIQQYINTQLTDLKFDSM
jgi:Rrf2 family protein